MPTQILSENFIKKALRALICFSIFLFPLLVSVKSFYIFTTLKYVFLSFTGSLVFLGIGLYLLSYEIRLDRKVKWILGLATGFLVWLFISSLFGISFQSSLWSNFTRHTGFLTYFFAWIFLVASLLVFNKDNLLLPLKAVMFGGFIASLSVYLSPALFDINWYFLKNSNNAGTFGNTTYAGIFLIFSVFFALIIFFKEKSRKWVWLLGVFLMVLSPIFLNTKNIFSGHFGSPLSLVGDSRAGLISLVLGLIFSAILYFYFSDRKVFSVLSKIALVAIFLTTIFILAGVLFNGSKLHHFVVAKGQGARLVYWDIATRAIGERPVIGYGLENFGGIHKKYFDPVLLSPNYPRELWTDKPHNVFLEMAFSAGVPGLAIYLFLIGFIFLGLIKKAQASDKEGRITASLFFGLLISYLAQLFFAFDTVSSIPVFFVTIALVSIFSFEEITHEDTRVLNKPIKVAATLAFLVLSPLMIYFFSFKVGQKSSQIKEIHAMNIEKRLSLFEKIMNISPTGRLENEAQYIEIVINGYKENWSTYGGEVRGKVKRNVEFLLQYAAKRSDEYPEDFRWALVSVMASNTLYDISKEKQADLLDISKKYGSRTISNSPFVYLGYLALAETFMLEGKLDQSERFVQMAVKVNPEAREFYDVLIYLAKLKKDPKLVEQRIKEARGFIPNYEYRSKI